MFASTAPSVMMTASFANSDGVICNGPTANQRCAVPVVSVVPRPGTRTRISEITDPR